jgi:hypothetical protein
MKFSLDTYNQVLTFKNILDGEITQVNMYRVLIEYNSYSLNSFKTFYLLSKVQCHVQKFVISQRIL